VEVVAGMMLAGAQQKPALASLQKHQSNTYQRESISAHNVLMWLCRNACLMHISTLLPLLTLRKQRTSNKTL
jgi:hypothetical protein